MKKFILLIIIVFLGLAIFYTVNPFATEEVVVEENEIDSVETTTQTLRAMGTIEPSKTIDLTTTKAETITEVNVEAGSEIEQEDLLYTYDDTRANLEFEQAKTQLEQAESTLEQAQKSIDEAQISLALAEFQQEVASSAELEVLFSEQEQVELELNQANLELRRLEQLYDESAIAEIEFVQQQYQTEILAARKETINSQINQGQLENENREQEAELEVQRANILSEMAQQEYKQAESALESARLNYQQAELELEKHQVIAPKSGFVLEKDIEVGEYVQPGQLALTIASNEFLIRISPDEREMGLLEVGMRGYASLEAYPEDKYEVEVIDKSPQVDSQRGTIDVYLEFKEELENLVPNMAVSVELEQ